jgi:hypothetical protein
MESAVTNSQERDIHEEPTAEPKTRQRRPWWLRVGAERPAVLVAGCGEEPCDLSGVLPVEVFCRAHDRLLPFPGAPESRQRLVTLSLLAMGVCLAFVLTAQSDNPGPLFAAGGFMAMAASILPLRRYPTSWRAVAVLFVLAYAAAFSAPLTTLPVHRTVGTLLSCLVVAGWGFVLLQAALRGGWDGLVSGGREPGQGEVAESVGHSSTDTERYSWAGTVVAVGVVTPAALLVYLVLAFGPAGGTEPVPAKVLRWLLVIAVAGVVMSVLVAVADGLLGVQGFDKTVGSLRVPVLGPQRLWEKRRPPVQQRPQHPLERLASFVPKTAFAIVNGAGRTAYTVRYMVQVVAHRAAVVAVGFANSVWRVIVLSLRYLGLAALDSAAVLFWSAQLALPSTRRATRVVLLPVLATGGVSAFIRLAAMADRNYLVDGGLRELAVTAGAGLAAIALAGLVWVYLCGLPKLMSLATAGRNLSISAPNAVMMLAIGGWVVGLPGTFGYGVIHVGWITGGATLAVAAAYVFTRSSRDARKQPLSVAEDPTPTTS